MSQAPRTPWGLSTSPANLTLVGIIVLVAVLANIAGYAFDLYTRYAWFDKVLHPYTIFALTLVCGLWLYGKVLTGNADHKILLVVVIVCVGVAIGALWEVAEWMLNQVVASDIIKGSSTRSLT